MFSGGRDSTIAAARLSESFDRVLLITVLSPHLIGIEKVRLRIEQLRKLLPKGSEWLQIIQPEFPIAKPFIYATCLPCQHVYVSTGALIALRHQIPHLAMGYSGYQSSWPEQTPYATAGLTRILRDRGIQLHLPVYDLREKEDAFLELARLGLGPESLEQKCLQQSSNIELRGERLKAETDRWLAAISETIDSRGSFPLNFRQREKIT